MYSDISGNAFFCKIKLNAKIECSHRLLKRWWPTRVLLGIHLSNVVHDDVVLGVPSISNDLLCLGNEAVSNFYDCM